MLTDTKLRNLKPQDKLYKVSGVNYLGRFRDNYDGRLRVMGFLLA